MAITVLKPTVIVNTAIALLQNELLLGNLVWDYSGLDWAGAKDDTVTLRLPAVATARDYEWRTRTADIVLDDLAETAFDLKIGGHVYSGTAITDEQMTLDINAFGAQILAPQMRAVAERLEGKLVALMSGAPYQARITFDAAGTEGDTTDGATSIRTLIRKDPFGVATAARKVLNANKVPMADRHFLIGADLEEAFLRAPQLLEVDKSGSPAALRDATIGKLAGFDVVVSSELATDEGYAFHRSAFAMATLAPVVPQGAAAGANASANGFAMRWIRDYDAARLRDRSVVSAFYGLQSINDGANIDPDGAGAGTAVASNIRAVKVTMA